MNRRAQAHFVQDFQCDGEEIEWLVWGYYVPEGDDEEAGSGREE